MGCDIPHNGTLGFRLASLTMPLVSSGVSLCACLVQARYSSSTDEDEMEDIEADDDDF
jgi:hypothetical protein